MGSRSAVDEVDRRILELLRENARRTIADIAKHVQLSPAPVKRRIERLEQLGVITGYTLVVDETQLGGTIEAFTELRFAGNTAFDKIAATAAAIPEVYELFTTAGDPDALARIRVHDIDHLKRVINQLRQDSQVTGTKTLMVLDRWSRSS